MHAQGFGRPRPARATRTHLRRTLRELAIVQIDSVNVLAPAHYLPAFSRLGSYDRAALDDLIYRKREFVEVWAHEASIVPVEHWALLRHKRLAHDRRLRQLAAFMAKHASYAAAVLDRVRTHGPLVASDVSEPDGTRGRGAEWWGWTTAKATLEGHFASGALAVSRRRAAGFAREYDIAENILPDAHRRDVDSDEALHTLLLIGARAIGIGTAADIADYHRVNIRTARAAIGVLAEQGALTEVRVEGWRDAAFLPPEATLPRRVEAAALLVPFDPLIWFRPRTERLFGFEYRIEIYVPEAKRRYGYYVFPFLLNERLVARVDLKADRANNALLVRAAHSEPDAPGDTVAALAVELRVMAEWLGVERVQAAAKGNLARELRAELRRSR